MTEETALQWLFNRTRAGDIRSGQRTAALLALLGQPQRHFDTIHVIGTNGKGSTCAMLAAGLEATGKQVGRFTSPHLTDFRERIAVNTKWISSQAVTKFIEWAQQNSEDAAFFDLTLAMALEYFRQQHVEIAVIEAGVGARHDATASIERVQATIITNIDLDHEATIGIGQYSTVLENIAWEKVGGIRNGIPVLTAARGAALTVIQAIAAEKQAPLHILNPQQPLFALPKPPVLRGAHQLENAALAVATLRLLGYTEQAVQAALEATWAGRLETITCQQSQVLLDGAHNPAGAHALAQALRGQHFSLVFAAMSRKRIPDILEPILPLAQELHFVQVSQQGVDPQELQQRYGGTAHPDLESAMKAALQSKNVLVAGSLYLVGAAREWMIHKFP